MAWVNGETDINDWSKLSDKSGALILAQGETVLKETIETAKGISSRAEKLITIQIPIATALIAFVFGSKSIEYLQVSAIVCLVIISTSFYYSYKNFSKYEIAIPGELPERILVTELIDNDLSKEDQYSQIVLILCENIQKRIELNEHSNAQRMANNTKSLNWLLLISFSPVVGFFLHKMFH